MDPTGDHKKKLRYEPPRIYEIKVDMAQAMGATRCQAGTNATGRCNTGSRAGTCSNGNIATSTCSGGSSGRTPGACTMGGYPGG
jgi:hypothetical protein